MAVPAARVNVEPAVHGETIRVRGLVQGVGFRPTVWRLAHELGLRGAVCNDSGGVLIELWGRSTLRDRFVWRLEREVPPLARIDALERAPLRRPPPQGFRILESRAGEVHTAIVPDAASCAACVAEISAPEAPRYRYAFTNCTHCGPRLSIVRRIPYDRANTSMGDFAMCATCQGQYDSPADRRFHAQPIACPSCGPHLQLEGTNERDESADAVACTQQLLRDGKIVAIKGIGGFHLACDAANAAAVSALRTRKGREEKPFALMARDLAVIRRYCTVSPAEATLLQSAAAPIVLVRKAGCAPLAPEVAPGQRNFGFMLPYSPLHHLLLADFDRPLVLTSGNRSDEPQCTANEEARERLHGIADAMLMHDREIVSRVDDSVARVIAGAPTLLRRARGYAPALLPLPAGFERTPDVLSFGGELKNTFCLLKDGGAILSQHIGDLEHARAQEAFRNSLALYANLFEHRPRAVAVDLHPDLLPSKLGRQHAAAQNVPLIEIQHHHAHIAACLIDNKVPLSAPPVLGLALDGLGFGADGTIWGGEVLLTDYCGFRRLGGLVVVPMPGGTAAIRQPWRMAFAHLRRLAEFPQLAREYSQLSFFRALAEKPLATLEAMVARRFNCPLTSSCGRLFDAVAAVCGIRQIVSYEGQAAIELEAAATCEVAGAYPLILEERSELVQLDPAPMWPALLGDLAAQVPVATVSARFHAGLAIGLANLLERLVERSGAVTARRVALSGGVFQNALLTELLVARLEREGWQVLRHSRVPPNDGGLALGQAAAAAARLLRGASVCA